MVPPGRESELDPLDLEVALEPLDDWVGLESLFDEFESEVRS